MADQKPTQLELTTAFTKVQSEKGWKYPIDKVVRGIDAVEQQLIADAIVHFTGSVPAVTFEGGGVRFKAAGYYLTIGS